MQEVLLEALQWLSRTYPPKEQPLGIVEESNDGCNDNSALRIVGHVLEDRCQHQEYDHDQ